MDINKEIIMTIVENSKGRLEYDQEFFEINEEQLGLISNKLTKLFSLHGVVDSKRRLEIWDNGYKQGYEDGRQGKQKHKDLGVY